MVILYESQTFPINPTSALPSLSISEMWEVMVLKCRRPELFVAPMSSSKVLEETDRFIKREVTFKEGMGPPSGTIIEDIELRAPWKADFRNLSSGAFVNNTVSQGKDETDLYLSFYFEWPYPDIAEGSEEAKKMSDQLWGMARKTIQHTIDYAREMKKDGELKG